MRSCELKKRHDAILMSPTVKPPDLFGYQKKYRESNGFLKC